MLRIFEQIFREASKARFINKIEGLSDEDKQKYIAFFDKYPNIQFDWNNKSLLNKEYLDKFIHDYEEKRLQKDKSLDRYRLGTEEDGARKMFKSHYPDLEIVYENDDWFFVWVKTYEGAKFCDSADCGSQRAQWCIGYEQNTYYWDKYTRPDTDYQGYLEARDTEDYEYEDYEEIYDDEEDFIYHHNNVFVMAYRKGKAKNDDLKFMLQINMVDNNGEAWRQTDEPEETIDKSEWEKFFNLPSSLLQYKQFTNYNTNITYNVANDVLYSVTDDKAEGISIFNNKIKYNTNINDKVTINNDFIIDNQWKAIKANAFKNCIFNGKIIITKDSSINMEKGIFNNSIINADIILNKSPETNIFGNAQIKGNLVLSDSIEYLSKNIFKLRYLKDEDIKIPNSVKEIEESAFEKIGCKSITLPEGITVIPNSAFYYAEIDTVILPDSITTIEEHAFEQARIHNLVLPKNLTFIGSEAFRGASIGSDLIIPDSISEIEPYTFCYGRFKSITLPKNLTCIKKSALENNYTSTRINVTLTIPDSVKIIEESALSGNYINNIPLSITSIGENAFKDSIFLNTIVIPNTIQDIKFGAFKNITINGSLILPDGLKVIGNFTFDGLKCNNPITIPNTVISIGRYAFHNCKAPVNNIPDSIMSIDDYAFTYCKFTKDIVLPESLKFIGMNNFINCNIIFNAPLIDVISIKAFEKCTFKNEISLLNIKYINNSFSQCELIIKDLNLKELQLAESEYDDPKYINGNIDNLILPENYSQNTLNINNVHIKSISNLNNNNIGYLSNITNSEIENLIIPPGTKVLPSKCFYNYTIDYLSLPKTLVKIDEEAFKDSIIKSDIVIPESVTYIGESTFEGAKIIGNIYYPNSITKISDYCFSEAEINSIISNSITDIGYKSFSRCKFHNELSLPNTLKNIESGAFIYAEFYSNFKIPDSVTSIGTKSFAYIKVKNLILPNRLEEISNGCFSYCETDNFIRIPNSVTKIEDFAFCKSKVLNILPENLTKGDFQGVIFNSDHIKIPNTMSPEKIISSYLKKSNIKYVDYKQYKNISVDELYKLLERKLQN